MRLSGASGKALANGYCVQIREQRARRTANVNILTGCTTELFHVYLRSMLKSGSGIIATSGDPENISKNIIFRIVLRPYVIFSLF